MNNINKKTSKGKRILATALALIMCLSLASCGSLDKIIDDLENAMETSGDKNRPSRNPTNNDDSSTEIVIEDTDGSFFEYERYSGGIAITKYTGEDTTVKIPKEIDGKTVLAINKNAIGDKALQDTTVAIKELIVPATVVEIERGAFAGCKSIVKYTAPFIGGSVDDHTYFGYVFGATSTSNNGSYVPPSLESAVLGGNTVDDDAFRGCDTLKSVTLQDVTVVGDEAFYGCSMLKTVILPDTVQFIGEDVFDRCDSLYELRLPFLGDGSDNLFLGYVFGAESHEENVDYVPSSLRKLTVGCGDSIPAYAFYECLYLSTVNIKGSPASVGEYAFYLCKKMRTLNMGDEDFQGPSVINSHSFAYCGSLNELKLSPAIDNIPAYGFYGCSSLRVISFGENDNVIPDSVTLGEYSFGYCSSIMEIKLPATMTLIPKGLFYGCTSLRQISLPTGVTAIEDEAFKGCSSLANVDFGANSVVETIGNSAFSYCSSLRGADVDSSEDSTLYVFTVPESVKSVGEYAFAYCDYLKRIHLPQSMSAIPDYCFFGCSALSEISFGVGENILGSSLWNIGSGAFYGCSAMESLTIPATVSVIGENAFASCDALVFRVNNQSEIYDWLIENGVGSSRIRIIENK